MLGLVVAIEMRSQRAATPIVPSLVLIETGSYLLLEDGSKLIVE